MPGQGGAQGQGGSAERDAATGNGGNGGNGGSANDDALAVSINLDVIPVWWGTSDAPQEPDVPPAPSADANCGMVSKQTVRKPVDVMLVLDRSTSMEYSIADDCYCTTTTTRRGNLCADTAACKTRWESIKPAISTTLSNSTDVNWGLKLFPTGAASCNVSGTVEVGITATSATEVQQGIDAAGLSSSTPTASGLTAAAAYLQALDDTNQKFILLATDGEPNCKGGTVGTADLEGAETAARLAKEAGIPVYVIGIGPNLGNLTKLAVAGGTTDYFAVTSPEQLAEALSSITTFVGSCTYTAPQEPEDPANVAVYVNKKLIEKNDDEGWKYGATNKEIVLTGSFCADITAGKETSVEILFGCKGAPPFPTIIP